MTALATEQRRKLETAIAAARRVAEHGARQALEALAVGRSRPYETQTKAQCGLRNRLRAHGRQLGDQLERAGPAGGKPEIRRLTHEVAYEHWHRMLFSRFLAENHLLIEPNSGVALTLAECEELARDEGKDTYALAAEYAQRMLPQIFRVDGPVLALDLPPEARQKLARLVAELPPEVFTASDSLGWTYQFWQAAEKDAVNARVRSGEKITGETLPAVTQLFTEPYMVSFLLDNTLGAWYAGKVLSRRPALAQEAASEEELREAIRLEGEPGYRFGYLRFVREDGVEADGEASGPWRPAAGSYESWPETAAEIRVLDPCCGSGHFLVAAFEVLVALRAAEEGLELREAIRCVLAENLAGLELDLRCTQIAAFNLAFTAWKMVGEPIELPALRVACSGLGPQATQEEWLALAEGESAAWEAVPEERRAAIRGGLVALHETFSQAPELGSLIDPREKRQDLFTAEYRELRPFLEAVYQAEGEEGGRRERAVAAQGMVEAAELLARPHYTLVLTNVPYLGRKSHTEELKSWIDERYKDAKSDLATVFVERMLRWGGTVAAVTPQNWLFLTGYRKLRERLLRERSWNVAARLGTNAFRDMNWWAATTTLLAVSAASPNEGHVFLGIDVSADKRQEIKEALLRGEALEGSEGASDDGAVRLVEQKGQLETPDARITLLRCEPTALLGRFATSSQGISTADLPRFSRVFWECGSEIEHWSYFQGASSEAAEFQGREGLINLVDLEEEGGQLGAALRGRSAWGRFGVAVRQMRHLPATLYGGHPFDTNVAVLVPLDQSNLPALWVFASSPAFNECVRAIDQKTGVTNKTFEKIPFDLPHWHRVASERYPHGLPEPYSDDPTQWLFHGHPAHAEPATVLQVAVARLLGYRWPAELDPSMHLAPEARAQIARCPALDGFTDGDGIVGIPAMRGEASATDRLTALLSAAFAEQPGGWTAARERDLLWAAAEAHKGKPAGNLDEWLRDQFFAQHCALFQKRPFVWHVWDGRKDGFQALVNYHKLAGPDGQGRRTLETLTYSYLGEWVDRQQAEVRAEDPDVRQGAEARLAAALTLKEHLEKILAGEPPCDLFVRWKPLHQQPLGWDPDLDDGVRLNMRPFLLVGDVKARGAGVLRLQPDKTWSNKKKPGVADRGKEPEALRPREDFPWFYGANPETHPDHVQDFGAGTPGAALTGSFDGVRWNGLHYSRAAKELARKRRARKQ